MHRSIVWWSLVAAELGRRRRRTVLTVMIYACLVAVTAGIVATVSVLQAAETAALEPVRTVDRDLYVTQTAGQGAAGEDIARSLAVEHEASLSAAVLDLARAGAPGQRFSRDIFLPITAVTFPTGEAAQLARIPGVASASAALTTVAVHQEGTIPEIVAEYTVPPATIALQPPTAAEQQAMQVCTQRFISSLPRPAQPSPKAPAGQAVDIPFTASYYACLPSRLRSVQIEQQVFQQVIDTPQTDIRTAHFTVAGVDSTGSQPGLLSAGDIVDGRFLAPTAVDEVVLQEAYARRVLKGVGSRLDLHGGSYRVVGLARPPLAGLADDVYMPLSELQRISGRDGRANVIALHVDSGQSMALVSRRVRETLPNSQVWTASDAEGRLQGSLRVAGDLARSGYLVALLVAFVAGCGLVGAVSWGAVSRRRHELATLRGLGWAARSIGGQVVAEELCLAALGIAAGVVLAEALLWATSMWGPALHAVVLPPEIGEQLRRPVGEYVVQFRPHLGWAGVGVAALAVLGGAVFCAAVAAARVSRVSPGHVLRSVG